ncbi:hypothetical protein PR048_000313 [Dryococelus australis]|uniref:Transposase n=1 Tax=Dryococelus australis TaxID=614101 RepID=A0ABQ9IEC9_9NEOP|nr:hypothetical protein PR048_000313 [Dryococelus australis]
MNANETTSLTIKQYLPNKAHKYGVKIFKVCGNRVYTWDFKIYEGTLRKNRKNLPIQVTKAKLKKGEIIAKESQDGILVLNWKDNRNVLILSTKQRN